MSRRALSGEGSLRLWPSSLLPSPRFQTRGDLLLSSLLSCRSARCLSSYLLDLRGLCESFQIGLLERLLGFSKQDADAISPYNEEEAVFLFLVFFFTLRQDWAFSAHVRGIVGD